MKIFNSKGLSLIEIVVYMGLSGVILLIGASLLQSGSQLSKNSENYMSLANVRTLVKQILKNNKNVEATMKAPENATSFHCFDSSSDCNGKGGNIALYSSPVNPTDPSLRIDLVSPPGSSMGFDFKGVPCNSFDPTNGNNDCPFRYVLTWTPKCVPTKLCINPTATFTANLEFKPKDISKYPTINLEAYKIKVSSKNALAMEEASCTAIGGTFDPVNQTCITNIFKAVCPHDKFIVGFKPDGRVICQTVKGHRCPKGEVLLGIDANGIAYCGPGCDTDARSSGSIW